MAIFFFVTNVFYLFNISYLEIQRSILAAFVFSLQVSKRFNSEYVGIKQWTGMKWN